MPAFCARKRHLQQQFPSSLYTQFFIGCQLVPWSTGPEQNELRTSSPMCFAEHCRTTCCSNRIRCDGLRWFVVVEIIEASAQIKKKLKKELNACRRFEYSSDQGEQIYEQSPTSGVRIIP